MNHILIIEDDPYINNFVAEAVKKSGYTCVQAFSGTEALLLLEKSSFHLIILDLMLPGMSGEEFIKTIKPDNHTPIIVVSAKDELDSKVDLLTLGAEDYITKPFEIKELLVRIAVQLRRSGSEQIQNQLEYQDLKLDKDTMQIIAAGNELSLTKQEFKILELLFRHPNKIFSKPEIYEYAWDDYYLGEDKTINVHISNIRQKLKRVSDKEYIETVWGVGFKLT
ncbi:MAG: response regulator transcription factor [Lachnospiraceae bacterium]